ncbi:hypothetical protein [Piscirickettsia litoralis]|uniref:Uncharacterized protein n=1 Tax=Piscirickettsia litoralis TaxID=1891921 RepID=A0ABX3A564_9GAMM|nr:hypothetical protein [Piscirickettsia litoralis]ODN43372.1 hypothetical protein BGC07_11110 [Piscirickettsia litoralis]
MKPKKEIINLITSNDFEGAKSALKDYITTDATGDDFGRHLQEAVSTTATSYSATPNEASKIQEFYALIEQQAMRAMTTNPTTASLLCRIRSTATMFPEIDLSDEALDRISANPLQQNTTPFAHRRATTTAEQDQEAGYSLPSCTVQ